MTHRPNAITHTQEYTVLPGVVRHTFIIFRLFTTPNLCPLTQNPGNATGHHLYADDTQLFISFQPTKFNENISCLQTALSAIVDWMTSNLCFNSAKTEFLLLGLKPQLNKIHNPALTLSSGASVCPSPSARNLGSPFPVRFLHLLARASTTSGSPTHTPCP